MFVDFVKRECKIVKKYRNPDDLSLMQIQHQYVKDLGFSSWSEFLTECGSMSTSDGVQYVIDRLINSKCEVLK